MVAQSCDGVMYLPAV